MVLEYCEHGSLHDFLKEGARHGINISMSLIIRFAYNIARGVFYLHHKCKVVQRDLKVTSFISYIEES
jgi:serine/threonine protein kinase